MKKRATLLSLLIRVATHSACVPSVEHFANVEELPLDKVKINIYYLEKSKRQQWQDASAIYLLPRMTQEESNKSSLSERDKIHDHLCNDTSVLRGSTYQFTYWLIANEIDTDVLRWECEEEEKSQSMILYAPLPLAMPRQKKNISRSIHAYFCAKEALQS